VAQHASGASSPIVMSLQLHYQSLVLPLERGDSSVVDRGLPDHDRQRSNRHSPTVKPEAPSAVYAPDDGRGDARSMLSHT
jgi:hypothetical protein